VSRGRWPPPDGGAERDCAIGNVAHGPWTQHTELFGTSLQKSELCVHNNLRQPRCVQPKRARHAGKDPTRRENW